jgi:tetratricopeptide (TPR) repeat protein
VPTARPGWRKWLFRLVVVLGLPLLLFGVAELGLRLAGYGYPTTFFVPAKIQGQPVLVENRCFGWRFFPPKLARNPSPTVLRMPKPKGVYRVVLFGESAALGDPRPAYGAGRYLETLLQERFPGTEFEVVCVAMTAINSHAIVEIARECKAYEGDLWILYIGNNEMAGPFGANTVFGAQAPPWWLARASLALQRTRTGQALVALGRRFRSGAGAPASWKGLGMFENSQLPPGDPRQRRVYRNFEHNLDAILHSARRAGVPVLLSSVVSNLRDCAPFASMHASSLLPTARGNFERLYRSGTNALAAGQAAVGRQALEQAVALSPEYADAHFELARGEGAQTNWSQAIREYRRARDLDALPFRADSRLNASVARAAERHVGSSVFYIDAARLLSAQAADGAPGHDLFLDHVHLNWHGNYWLARTWAERITSILPASVHQHELNNWPDEAACARRLGLTDWNRLTILQEMLQRLADPPYTGQSDHAREMKELTGQLLELQAHLSPALVPRARALYEAAIQRRPGDHWLHHNYAEFLTATGDLDQAAAQLEIVCNLLPHHYAAYFHLGRLLAREGKDIEARRALMTSLRLGPENADACLELGQIDAREGKLADAFHECDTAEHLRTGDAEVHLLRARLFQQQNKRPEAIQSLRDAVRLRPSSWEAQELLGMQLALAGDLEGAQSAFQQVVRVRPEYAEGHLNFGMALARRGKLDPALEEFREASRLEPTNVRAREFIQTAERLKASRAVP